MIHTRRHHRHPVPSETIFTVGRLLFPALRPEKPKQHRFPQAFARMQAFFRCSSRTPFAVEEIQCGHPIESFIVLCRSLSVNASCR